MKKIGLLMALTFSVTACATPDVITISRPTDLNLSCDQIMEEIAVAEKFKKDALDDKGVTGTNAAAAVFFWPALFFTYDNIDDAVDAADGRIEHLNRIYMNQCVDNNS
ncbi:MAG: hypothetical protein ACKVIX_04915 [Sphingomonadales bacterium]|jgi:hypothetical protein